MKSTKATDVLLKAGAWLVEGPCKQTELHEAAANGLLEILEMFLEDPRITVDDVNRSDGCGRTPLYRAAHGGHRESLKALISKGGSLAHISKTKETVMDVIFARISRPSNFIKDLLDSRITGNDFKPTDENYRVNLGKYGEHKYWMRNLVFYGVNKKHLLRNRSKYQYIANTFQDNKNCI